MGANTIPIRFRFRLLVLSGRGASSPSIAPTGIDSMVQTHLPENFLPIEVRLAGTKVRNALSIIWIISMEPFMSVRMAHISLMMVGSGIRVEYQVFGVSIAGCLITSGNPKTVRPG